MIEQQLSGPEMAYWICAIAGTALFTIRILLAFTGIFGEMGHGHFHIDAPHADVDHGSFWDLKLFSVSTITAFLMVFGWVGLASTRQFGTGTAVSFFVAVLLGLVFMVVIAWLFRAMFKLDRSASRFHIEKARGQRGTVSERISGKGKGRIQLHVEGMTRDIDAIAADGADIESFKNVEVVDIVDEHTVSVREVGSGN